jgi:hypothetical protein
MIYGAVGFIVFILLVYIYAKDSEVSKKFFLYEKSIEDLNKKIYDLEKRLNEKNSSYDKEEIKEYIDEIIEENLQKISGFVLSSKKEQDSKLSNIKDEVIEKLQNLDEKIKNFTSLPESYQSNEKKIINLYHKGLSVSEIARNLRIGIGEVELVLKIEGIK